MWATESPRDTQQVPEKVPDCMQFPVPVFNHVQNAGCCGLALDVAAWLADGDRTPAMCDLSSSKAGKKPMQRCSIAPFVSAILASGSCSCAYLIVAYSGAVLASMNAWEVGVGDIIL